MAVVKFRIPGPGSGKNNRNDFSDRDEDREDYGEDSGTGGDGYSSEGPEDRGDSADAEEPDENPEDEYEEEPAPDVRKKQRRARSKDKIRPKKRLTRKQKFLLLLRILIIATAAAAVIAFLVVQQENRSYTTAEYSRTAAITTSDTMSWRAFGGKILSYGKDGASLTDTDGRAIWNITFEMQQPLIAVCRNTVAIGDYEGSTIYVMDTSGQMGQIATNLPVKSLSVAENGNVAAVLEDTDATWIYLFDKTGNTIAYIKRTMEQSGYPAAAAVSPDGSLLCCSQLSVDSSSVKTSVAFYNFSAVGQSAVDNCVSGYDYSNEVVPYVSFLNENTSIAVSDSRIAFFTGSDVPVSLSDSFFQTDLEGVYTGDNYVGLLFPDTSGKEEYELDIYNMQGKVVGRIPFTMEYTDIQIAGDRVLIDDGQNLMIWSVTGKEKYSGVFQDSVNAVIPSSSPNRLTLVTDDSIESMTLR